MSSGLFSSPKVFDAIKIIAFCSLLPGCSSIVLQPRPIDSKSAICPTPNYPKIAIDSEASGVTVIQFDVEVDGTISDAQVFIRSGNTPVYAVLDQAVLNAVEACRFPALKPNSYLKARVMRRYVWKLDNGLTD